MRKRNLMDWAIIAIAMITMLSGIGQIAAPRAVLSMMQVTISPETVYLFVVVSLLTSLFGAALLHALLSRPRQTAVVFWASVQKVLGAAAVLIAALNDIIARSALLAAGYDFLAGIFIFGYWIVIRD
jgi:hypothetical protein